MKRGVIVSIVGAGAVALAAGGWLAWHFHFSPEAKAIALVRSQLVDPDSAQFDNVTYYPQTKGICGNVNAKNRRGGYVGRRWFVVTGLGELRVADEKVYEDGKTTAEQLEISSKRIDWLRFVLAHCPEDEKPEAVTPTIEPASAAAR